MDRQMQRWFGDVVPGHATLTVCGLQTLGNSLQSREDCKNNEEKLEAFWEIPRSVWSRPYVTTLEEFNAIIRRDYETDDGVAVD